jgi:hypothetical protein
LQLWLSSRRCWPLELGFYYDGAISRGRREPSKRGDRRKPSPSIARGSNQRRTPLLRRHFRIYQAIFDVAELLTPGGSLYLRWNLKDEIMSQLADISRWGAKFAMSIPEQSVI